MWVSPETIYLCLYLQARGELRTQLKLALRHGRTRRVNRSQTTVTRGKIPDRVNISERPVEAADRAVAGFQVVLCSLLVPWGVGVRVGERWCPRWESNPHWDPFKGPASAGWATGALRKRIHRRVDQEALVARANSAFGSLIWPSATTSRRNSRAAVQSATMRTLRLNVGIRLRW